MYLPHSKALTPDPEAMNFPNFVRGVYGHHNHAYSFSQIYMGAVKIFLDSILFYYMAIWA